MSCSNTSFSIAWICTSWLIGCVVSVAAIGCGDSDDNNGSRRFESGIDDDTQVSMLEPDEQREICENVSAHVSTYLDFEAIAYVACIPGAIWTTTTAEACRVSLANCMAVFPPPIKIEADVEANRQACYRNLDQCQATVAQLEGCVDVNLNRALSIFDAWTCDRVGDMQIREMAEPSPSTALVCADVNAACNQFSDVNGPD